MKFEEKKYTDILGNNIKTDCIGCAIHNGEIEGYGGAIMETKFFHAHQDFEIPIPGFVILASRRHVKGIDELTNEEQIDFIKIISKIRYGMRKTLNIDFVYLIQLEDTAHHFHFWIFPRYDWMMEKFGNKIASVKPIIEYAKQNLKTKDNLNEVIKKANKLKEYLKNN